MRKQMVCFTIWIAIGMAVMPALSAQGPGGSPGSKALPELRAAESCISCHTGILSPSGQDLSFAALWRAGMMAHSSRDPYWIASVRREVQEHSSHRAEIEDECSACHMPMARYLAKAAGGHGEVFSLLPMAKSSANHAELAADGVSCTVCHQISTEGLGQASMYNGGFRLSAPQTSSRAPQIHGPYEVDAGRKRIMSSSSEFEPAQAAHIREAALCAGCHTLITTAYGASGEVTGQLPEQVPYLEWKHSSYGNSMACQECHMPPANEKVSLSPVLGEPREHLSAHSFLGGNFLMMRIFNRFRRELAVKALPEELEAAVIRTEKHLASEAADLRLSAVRQPAGRLRAEVRIDNLAGHKLPTAYPSRRAWIHLVVRDRDQKVLLESGAPSADGRIVGNDNDADGTAYEPHYAEITTGEQVQIYESILGDPKGAVTTGLLTAVRYIKDNRLLPRGFDKRQASPEVAVHGAALSDPDFEQGGDRLGYSVDVSRAEGPFTIQAKLYYQSIGFRWARNLAGREEEESRRFTRYYGEMAPVSALVLAEKSFTVD